MRYYGGGPVGMGNAGVFNNSSIGGIPVGEDPRFPMSQEQFWNEADRIKIQNIPPGDVLKRFKEIHGPKLRGASVPVGDPMGSIGNLGGLENAQFYGGPQYGQTFEPISMEPPYSAQERADDQILLRSLQKGEMGSGPQIDKAIQDIIQRTSMGGTGLRGV
jgi:hypothetical protein